MLGEYDSMSKDKFQQGIIEKVPSGETDKGEFHFICHHAVISNDHDTTKVKFVFDRSAKSRTSVISVNEHLRIGNNTLQHIFDNILCFCSHSILLKAFLQIEINEANHHFVHFLWFEDVNTETVYRRGVNHYCSALVNHHTFCLLLFSVTFPCKNHLSADSKGPEHYLH